MENLQIDASKNGFLFTITGMRSLIQRMAEEGTTKVNLLNVDIEDIQNVLQWEDFYFKISELKQLEKVK